MPTERSNTKTLTKAEPHKRAAKTAPKDRKAELSEYKEKARKAGVKEKGDYDLTNSPAAMTLKMILDSGEKKF